MKLNELRDNPGARKKRLRVGRGMGSGKGKTAARGQKGFKSRSGASVNGFEGGQMPIHMRLPKRGFNKRNRADYAWVNLGRLQAAIDAGKIKKGSDLDAAALIEAGLVRREKDGIRLLAKGELKDKISLTVSGASKAAVEAVEKAGGAVTIKEKAPAKAEDGPEKAE